MLPAGLRAYPLNETHTHETSSTAEGSAAPAIFLFPIAVPKPHRSQHSQDSHSNVYSFQQTRPVPYQDPVTRLASCQTPESFTARRPSFASLESPANQFDADRPPPYIIDYTASASRVCIDFCLTAHGAWWSAEAILTASRVSGIRCLGRHWASLFLVRGSSLPSSPPWG